MKNTLRSNKFFMILIIIQIAGSIAVSPIIKHSGLPAYSSLIITEYGLIFVPSIIFLIVTRQPLKEALRLNPINIPSFLIIILIGIFSYPVIIFIGLISQLFFHNLLADSIQVLSSLPLWGSLLLLAVTPAICEETAMRGAVLSGYKNVSIKKAAIMNGFLFGIFHMNPQQFFYAFALGVIFVYLVEITDSIFSSMLCHFTCNGLSFTISYFAMKGMKNLNIQSSSVLSDKQALLQGTVVWLVIAGISFVIVVFLIKLLKSVNRNKGMENREIKTVFRGIYSGGQQNSEKVMNWPVYGAIAIYFGFVIFAQTVLNIHMIN